MGVRMWTNKLEPGERLFVTNFSDYAVVPDAPLLRDLFL